MKIGSNKAVGEYRVARKETIIYDDEITMTKKLSVLTCQISWELAEGTKRAT